MFWICILFWIYEYGIVSGYAPPLTILSYNIGLKICSYSSVNLRTFSPNYFVGNSSSHTWYSNTLTLVHLPFNVIDTSDQDLVPSADVKDKLEILYSKHETVLGFLGEDLFFYLRS